MPQDVPCASRLHEVEIDSSTHPGFLGPSCVCCLPFARPCDTSRACFHSHASVHKCRRLKNAHGLLAVKERAYNKALHTFR